MRAGKERARLCRTPTGPLIVPRRGTAKPCPPTGELAKVAAVRQKAGYAKDDAGFTAQEYAAEFKLSYNAAVNELDRMVESGQMLTGKARRRDSVGVQRRVNVFRSP